MKKTLLISMCAGTLLASGSAMADIGPGCGVGAMVFEGSTGLFAHTSAGTTNGSLGQPFAITSGTSGCDTSQQVYRSDEKEIFVATNMDTLSQEIAQGQGNYLNTLAIIMGIDEKDQASFATSLQSEYDSVFASSNTSSSEVIAAIDTAMLKDASLAKYVR